ncbi:MAG: hypothetical protein MH204_08005, partial [Fimbriimonadaceae bacterium]|nr:hypothetical protein [Fimbriimonadaceae bacterium]
MVRILQEVASVKFVRHALAGLAVLACLLAASSVLASPGGSSVEKEMGRVMFIGHSFVEGHDSATLGWKGGYRKIVEDRLLDAGWNFSFVGANQNNSDGMLNPAHNGYGGQGIDSLFAGIEREGVPYGGLNDWTAPGSADIFVVDVGRKTEEGKTVEELEAQFNRVADAIFRSNPQAPLFWVQQTDPLPVWYPGEDQHIARVNLALDNVAAGSAALGRFTRTIRAQEVWDTQL